MTYKICEYCGKEFEPSTSNQKHCSRDCGIRNWNKHKTNESILILIYWREGDGIQWLEQALDMMGEGTNKYGGLH